MPPPLNESTQARKGPLYKLEFFGGVLTFVTTNSKQFKLCVDHHGPLAGPIGRAAGLATTGAAPLLLPPPTAAATAADKAKADVGSCVDVRPPQQERKGKKGIPLSESTRGQHKLTHFLSFSLSLSLSLSQIHAGWRSMISIHEHHDIWHTTTRHLSGIPLPVKLPDETFVCRLNHGLTTIYPRHPLTFFWQIPI